MALHLYYHPFSSFCQKVLIALYERELEYTPHLVNLIDEREKAELASLWPFAKFPVLADTTAGATVPESSSIIEHLDTLPASGAKLIPDAPQYAASVRQWDRIIDTYLHVPMQKIVGDRLRPEGSRDPFGVEEARQTLATAYRFMEQRLPDQGWLGGGMFCMADCAAAPPLFYLSRVAPFADRHPRLQRYFLRLMERPSFQRCIEGAREYRDFFPAAEGDAGWSDKAAASEDGARLSF